MTALVVGLGATHGDDAVGPAVARRLASVVPTDVEVVETDDPSSLLDLWVGHDTVVVVDAMRSHAPVGATVALDAVSTRLPTRGWAAGGTHALGLAQVVELARALERLPGHLVVVGVEVESTQPTTAMTVQVALAVADAAELVLAALRDCGDRAVIGRETSVSARDLGGAPVPG